MRILTLHIFAYAVVLVGCSVNVPSKQDVLETKPILDEVYEGDYQAAAACTLDRIQTADYKFASGTVQYVPVPTLGYVEIQTTGDAGGLFGQIYPQITRFEDIDGSEFRVIVRAGIMEFGIAAVDAVRKCVEVK